MRVRVNPLGVYVEAETHVQLYREVGKLFLTSSGHPTNYLLLTHGKQALLRKKEPCMCNAVDVHRPTFPGQCVLIYPDHTFQILTARTLRDAEKQVRLHDAHWTSKTWYLSRLPYHLQASADYVEEMKEDRANRGSNLELNNLTVLRSRFQGFQLFVTFVHWTVVLQYGSRQASVEVEDGLDVDGYVSDRWALNPSTVKYVDPLTGQPIVTWDSSVTRVRVEDEGDDEVSWGVLVSHEGQSQQIQVSSFEDLLDWIQNTFTINARNIEILDTDTQSVVTPDVFDESVVSITFQPKLRRRWTVHVSFKQDEFGLDIRGREDLDAHMESTYGLNPARLSYRTQRGVEITTFTARNTRVVVFVKDAVRVHVGDTVVSWFALNVKEVVRRVQTEFQLDVFRLTDAHGVDTADLLPDLFVQKSEQLSFETLQWVNNSCYLDSVLMALLVPQSEVVRRDLLRHPPPLRTPCGSLSLEESTKIRDAMQDELRRIATNVDTTYTCANLRQLIARCPGAQEFHGGGMQEADEFLRYLLQLFQFQRSTFTSVTELSTSDGKWVETSRNTNTDTIAEVETSLLHAADQKDSPLELQHALRTVDEEPLNDEYRIPVEYVRAVGWPLTRVNVPYGGLKGEHPIVRRTTREFRPGDYAVINVRRAIGRNKALKTQVQFPPRLGRLELQAVVVHHSAHYVCYVRLKNTWYLYNDNADVRVRLVGTAGTFSDLVDTKAPYPAVQGSLYFYF